MINKDGSVRQFFQVSASLPACFDFSKSSDGAVQRFDKSLEEFYGLCDQLELCLVRCNPLQTPLGQLPIYCIEIQSIDPCAYHIHMLSCHCSGWRMSASPRASTAPNTHPTWSLQPPSLTQCRQSQCLMPNTSAWSSLRSLVLKTSTMLCWNARRRSQERDSLRESCRTRDRCLSCFLVDFYIWDCPTFKSQSMTVKMLILQNLVY